MKVESAYIILTHPYDFRSGEPAKILGVKLVTLSPETPPRLCFRLRWENGVEDLVPLENPYKIHNPKPGTGN